MNRQEAEIFQGIFKRLGYFEIPEVDCSENETKEILESFKSESLPEALHELTMSIIRHIEAMPDPVEGHKKRMIS